MCCFVLVKVVEIVCVEASSLEADLEAVCSEEICLGVLTGHAPVREEWSGDRLDPGRTRIDTHTVKQRIQLIPWGLELGLPVSPPRNVCLKHLKVSL